MNQTHPQIQDDPEFHATDIGVQRLKNTILALEQLENDLIGVAREALEGHLGSVPTSEADLRLLEVARQRYRDCDFGVLEMIDYLSSFAEFESHWLNVSRSVIRVFEATCDTRRQSWHIWTEQFHRTGTRVWHEAVPACYTIQVTIQRHQSGTLMPQNWSKTFNSICQRLRLVDDVMDQIYPRVFMDRPGREHYEDEFRDTAFAVQAINNAEGPDSSLTPQQIFRFKSAIRANRLAEETRLNTGDASVSPSAMSTGIGFSALSAGLSRRIQQPDSGGSSTASATTGSVSDGNTSHTSPLMAKEPDAAKYNPTLVALVVIITVLSGFLTALGWNASPHERGTTADADFWFLLQGSLMQIASLVPVVFTLLITGNTMLHARVWSWAFLASGILFAFLAPFLYTHVPTEVSAVVAFCGSVSQALIVLETIFLVERASNATSRSRKVKREIGR